MKATNGTNLGALLLLISSLGGFSSCGMFGGTTAFTLKNGIPSVTGVRLSFEELAREPESAKTVAVMVYPFSGYDASTEKNLASSLGNTIAAMNPSAAEPERKIAVHVIMRRYMIAASNEAGAVLACVSWALVEQRRVIFSEQFYAAAQGRLTKTVGAVKDDAARAIVQRIALRAAWASRPPSERGGAPVTEKTFDDIDSAVFQIPAEFVTTTTIASGVYLAASKSPQWGWAEVSRPFEWEIYLAERGLIDLK